MIGSSISHYKILEKLGEGGMGVVYKAEDTNLERVVALKFMPHHIIPDEAEEARFLQEAKAASSLNHPNVCTIYGIEKHEGNRFIAMEYIDGTTLRHKMPIAALNEAIRYGIQIGDALHEAHSRGIVHRDIKADNIMINARDQVKVMDFGLAKLKGTLRVTKATSTVGTLAYMSPEQIQGGEVDARSDIFSYGVLLYEMITGRLPYRSEHEAALMYSIINEEPDPVEKYRTDLPPVLTNLIQRALEKDPNDRYQSINEMVIELRRLQKQSSRVSRASVAAMPAQAAAPPSGSGTIPTVGMASGTIPAAAAGTDRRRMPLVSVLAASVVVLAAVWYFFLRPSTGITLNPAMAFRTLNIPVKEIGYPALSADGGWVAFAGTEDGNAWDVYLMNAGSGNPRRITTDSAAFMQDVDLSPDGSQIVYDRTDKSFTKPEIAIVSSLGGSSKRIVNIGFSPRWRPDGERIAYVASRTWGSASGKFEFRSVKPNGSDDRLEFADSLGALPLYAWSPDGESICYVRRISMSNMDNTELIVRRLANGEERQLTSLGKIVRFVSWSRNGQIAFSSNVNGNDNLWIVPASGGKPVQVTRGSGPDFAPYLSNDGKRLIYIQEQSIGKVWLGSLRGEAPKQLTFDDVYLDPPEISPDGSKVLYVLFTRSLSGWTSELFTLDVATGKRTVLMSDEGSFHQPKWSPDGKLIAYAYHPDSIAHDSAATYMIEANNPGSPKRIGTGFPFFWIDSRTLLTEKPYGTRRFTIDSAEEKIYFRDSTIAYPVLRGAYAVTRDVVAGKDPGIWIEKNPSEGTAGPERRLLIKHLASPVYCDATASLYYVTPQSEVHRILLPGGKETVVVGSYPNLHPFADISVSADGSQFVYLDSKNVRKMVMIDNLQ
jgi:Tol biopolymer transport system component/predicted Ser/Thr protein kinase